MHLLKIILIGFGVLDLFLLEALWKEPFQETNVNFSQTVKQESENDH